MTETSGVGISDDEFTVLSIAHEGQSMIPIGRWQKPVESLRTRGYMLAIDGANYIITTAGRTAWKAADAERDKGLGQMIEMASRVGNARHRAAELAEAAALKFAAAVSITVQTTGETQDVAVALWGNEILRRTMVLLNSKDTA